MPKPTSKQELLTVNAEAFVSMFNLIDSLVADEKELEFPFSRTTSGVGAKTF
jgi:hypothetical protein